MRTITLLLSAFFCVSVSAAQKWSGENQKSKRIEKIINSQWTFNYFPSETADKGYESPGFDDSKWPAISLPHVWNTFETTGELHDFIRNNEINTNPYWWIGWGWYRKHFSINSNYSGRKVFIEFEGVQKYCKVWINGKYLGDNKNEDGSFDFDLTQFIRPGEDNVLAVAVNNPQKDGLNQPPVAAGDLVYMSGIYRNITLVLTDNLYIPMQGSAVHEGGTVITTQQISEKEGVVKVQVWVKNDNTQKKTCTLQTTITDATNKIVQVTKSSAVINSRQLYKFDQTGKPIKNPHLWSAKDPYLYKVITEVIDGKEVTDSYTSPHGLKFSITGDTPEISTANLVPVNPAWGHFKNSDEVPVVTGQAVMAGEPAKIILSASHQKIGADRSSVATITADIVDSKGNHVRNATNTVKWTVTGPATLVGPSVYESEINTHHQTEGLWYKNMPVSNVIRSTGKPGKIKIAVSATGLASGSFFIAAEEIKKDNSVIIEPLLQDEERKPVARITLNVNRLDEVPREIKLSNDEFNPGPSDKSGFARLISDHIMKNNPSVVSESIEYKELVDLFASHLLNNNGRLAADDYNFSVDYYNNCRLISGYINSTKLPLPFKEGLKKYYANTIIRQGRERNAGEEMNWLNWIPSGGTVVVFQEGTNVAGLKGVKVTNKSDLAGLIAVVYPGFVKFSDEAKERALLFISKMNPYIHVTYGNEQNLNGEKKLTNVSYTAEKGQPVLIPLLKFISE